ncbi:TonB-dependent receptor [Sphingobacterium sp. SGG-5]|uniref:SusC/RagA family TonB-linked outer membrane protein n=1 Tax=Sphingobacterium sp. SGG-5 TaxID=2710881 RepID=UPI0013EDD4B8|nr:TonB-dependent receptor [Sphingobacterium sp. SGG-5]NGM61050.1 TonB-dependent receptor [Sphingobacterium sp. SGG-5]
MKLILSSLLIIISVSAFAQHLVRGKVSDSDGPISGVTVVVKGSTQRTTTDGNGDYIMPNVKASDILVFSYIGFQTVEKIVLEQSTINVQLAMEERQIEEVAVGYQVIQKKDLTGAVASINPDDLASTATANFDQALAGRVAGVQVTSSDGTPGSAMNIVIRGGNSITGDNSPLYVVDGVPYEDFDPSTINTRDIKSFDILKDASATAIYGSRGANGVVVITTLGGRNDGKTDIKAGAYTWLQYIPTRLEVMSPYEYVLYQQKIAYATDNYVPGQNLNMFYNRWIDPELYRDEEGINWQNEIFQNANTQNYTISMRGGTPKTGFYYSGNFTDQNGTLITTGFKKINNLLKLRHEVTDKFEVTMRAEYNRLDRVGSAISGGTTTSVIRDAISFRPINPVNWTAEDEEEFLDEAVTDDIYLYDPVRTLNNTERTRANDVIGGNIGLNYKFSDKWTLNLLGSYHANITENTLFYKEQTQQAQRSAVGINGSITDTRVTTASTSNTLQYNDRKGKHVYGGLAGLEIQGRSYQYSQLRNTNLLIDHFGIRNLGLATAGTIAQTDFTKSTLLSFFGRGNYTYDNRYLATVNFRADASSKFRPENRWGYFPSFSLAWRISNEKFMKAQKDITEMKLRAGWGMTGNDRINSYAGFDRFGVSTTSGYVLGEGQAYMPGVIQTNMAVPDLRWETTKQSNIGLDIAWKKRIDITADYYIKNTVDLLLNADMSPSTGFDRVQQNIGEVSNRGFEFTVNSKNIQKKDFRWSTNFNITFNRTKAVRLNDGQVELLTDPRWNTHFMSSTEYQYVTRVGQPVGMMYGMVYDRLYQADDFLINSGGAYEIKPGIPTIVDNTRPGMVKFKDINGDGKISELDRTIIGNPHPKHIGGLNNSFRYKTFDLQFMFQWAYDFDLLNGNKSEMGNYFIRSRNGLRSLNDIWTPTHTDTDVSGSGFDGRNLTRPVGYRLDDRHIDDGSYLKLKTVVLGYNLNSQLLSRLRLKRCRLSLSAQNLYTWTKYEGYDPDVSVGRYGALTPGLDYSAYPQSVTLSGGIEITF